MCSADLSFELTLATGKFGIVSFVRTSIVFVRVVFSEEPFEFNSVDYYCFLLGVRLATDNYDIRGGN